jgi:hypothetical protein
MLKMRGLGLAACLAGLLLAGCSRPVPPPLLNPTPPATAEAAKTGAAADKSDPTHKVKKGKEVEDPTQAYKTASEACQQQATHTTMGSVLAIFTRLRPGAYNADYNTCMKAHGYDMGQ